MLDPNRPFKANSVYVPAGKTSADKECTPLMLDSENDEGWLYTQEQWESDGKPQFYRRPGGECVLAPCGSANENDAENESCCASLCVGDKIEMFPKE